MQQGSCFIFEGNSLIPDSIYALEDTGCSGITLFWANKYGNPQEKHLHVWCYPAHSPLQRSGSGVVCHHDARTAQRALLLAWCRNYLSFSLVLCGDFELAQGIWQPSWLLRQGDKMESFLPWYLLKEIRISCTPSLWGTTMCVSPGRTGVKKNPIIEASGVWHHLLASLCFVVEPIGARGRRAGDFAADSRVRDHPNDQACPIVYILLALWIDTSKVVYLIDLHYQAWLMCKSIRLYSFPSLQTSLQTCVHYIFGPGGVVNKNGNEKHQREPSIIAIRASVSLEKYLPAKMSSLCRWGWAYWRHPNVL